MQMCQNRLASFITYDSEKKHMSFIIQGDNDGDQIHIQIEHADDEDDEDEDDVDTENEVGLGHEAHTNGSSGEDDSDHSDSDSDQELNRELGAAYGSEADRANNGSGDGARAAMQSSSEVKCSQMKDVIYGS